MTLHETLKDVEGLSIYNFSKLQQKCLDIDSINPPSIY